LVLGVLVGSAWTSIASADQKATTEPKTETSAPRSIGFPNKGSLVGGKRLETSETLHASREHRWGLPILVGLIERAAARVADKHPGAILVVGDLSRESGGEIKGHDSHESGRDVDLGFYLSKDGEPFITEEHLVIDREGSARSKSGVRFDDARNWTLVESLLLDRDARVMQIFVSYHLRTRLMREARRANASAEALERARAVLVAPRTGQRHDDHFHVRIRCPKGQKDCVDFPARRFVGAAATPSAAPPAKAVKKKKATKKAPVRAPKPKRQRRT
jgi:penicillin-insensitive murein endopeptidase